MLFNIFGSKEKAKTEEVTGEQSSKVLFTSRGRDLSMCTKREGDGQNDPPDSF